MELAAACRAMLPLSIHEHYYEKLVSDFDATVQAVCEFLGIEWTEAMRDFAGRAAERVIRSPSAAQVRRPLHRESVGAWRRYAEQLAPVLPILEPMVQAFGYSKA